MLLVDPNAYTSEKCRRVKDLIDYNAAAKTAQRRIRDIMNGGPKGLRALAGRAASKDMELLDSLPAGNPMLSGITRLAQKLQQVPDLRVPAPKDTNAAREHAERRERIVRALDEQCALELQVPKVARWFVGYGFAVWVIEERHDGDGSPYPHMVARDPMDTYPGPWGVDGQPDDIAFVRNIPITTLTRLYPQHAKEILGKGPGGGYILSGTTSREEVQIAEYYDRHGCWWVVPDRNLLLEFIENPLRNRPAFEVVKRFTFDELQGQFDHVIGLMSMQARLSVMQAQWVQDNVHQETNIFGQAPAGGYRKGRFAINEFEPGTRVEKVSNSMPFQAFQAIDRIERQLRTTSGYSVTDDGQSPANTAATRAGLEELNTSSSLETRENQTAFRHGFENGDSKRLEWEDRRYGDTERTIVGEFKGEPYVETYKPSIHIAGNYKTRRKYGFMAGWDESTKLVGGLQLVAGKIIPRAVMRENLDGLDESLTRVEELIGAEEAHDTLTQIMLSGQPVDDRVLRYLISRLPAGPDKESMEDIFFPEEEEAVAGAEPALPAEPPGLEEAMAMMGGGGESLARLTAGGNVGGGVQTEAAF